MFKVGEYIRTKNGLIFKATEYWLSELTEEIKENIKAHSKNIIDLIEVGDYVNGTKVTNIDNYDNIYTIEWEYGDVYTTEIINDKFIKTILTHEMYEQNCYKVGDIE